MKELKLNYEQARNLQQRIKEVLGCRESLVAPIIEEATKVPRLDLESIILCKEKERRLSHGGKADDYCAVTNGLFCPFGFPTDNVLTIDLG